MKIILGSASQRRAKILKEMGYDFEIIPADIDEKAIRNEDPSQLTLALAHAKADALISKLVKQGLLITSDSVVVFEGKILEKPQTKQEAMDTLNAYGDKPSQVVNSVVVVNLVDGRRAEGTDVSRIWFKPFDNNLFEQFVDTGLVFEHAGSYGAEREMFAPYIAKIEGTIDSIAGFPKALVQRLIDQVK